MVFIHIIFACFFKFTNNTRKTRAKITLFFFQMIDSSVFFFLEKKNLTNNTKHLIDQYLSETERNKNL